MLLTDVDGNNFTATFSPARRRMDDLFSFRRPVVGFSLIIDLRPSRAFLLPSLFSMAYYFGAEYFHFSAVHLAPTADTNLLFDR